jgi:peptidoglycan/xylan/chitin deacetylase (PgdA/CDA1 family)
MRLQQCISGLRQGTLPNRAVVVTFDDGYADNLYNAKPLLERSEIPATVFITAGYVGRQREFWWDELERLLLPPASLPRTLALSVNGSRVAWELEEATHGQEDAGQRGDRTLDGDDHPSQQHRLHGRLYQLLMPLREEERRRVLDDLVRWTGGQSACRATHRPLSTDEARSLAMGELIEIGAHTVTHPVLSALPGADQVMEIRRGRAMLEEVLARPVTSFSYPFGHRLEHYTEETVGIVREAGFTCACAAFAGAVRRGTRLFELPRVFVPDWNGDAFARGLKEWFLG